MRTEALSIVFFLSAVHCLQIGLLYSPQTPFNIAQVLRLTPSGPHTLTPILISAREEIALAQQEVLLDYLYAGELSAWAREMRSRDKYVRMWGE